jgi:transcriptional regulator with XRE-family HTH domain
VHSTTQAIPARAIGRARVTQALPTTAEGSPFGAYFDDLLAENGLTDTGLAALTDLDKSTFSHWRSGKSKPQVDALRLIRPHVNRTLIELMIAAGRATAEEFGINPAAPLPKEIDDVMRTMSTPMVAAEDKQALLHAIGTIHDLFYREVAHGRRATRSGRR